MWIHHLINRLETSSHGKIDVIITVEDKGIQVPKKKRLFKYFMDFDKSRYKLSPNALELKPISNTVQCSRLQIQNLHNTKSKHLEDQLQQIRNFNLDVLLDLTQGLPITIFSDTATYGLWFYYHGDYKKTFIGTKGAWEFLKRDITTTISLQLLNKDGNLSFVLYESQSSTDKFGIHRNNNAYLWKASTFVDRVLKTMQGMEPDTFFSNVKQRNNEPIQVNLKKYKNPRNWDVFKGLVIDTVKRIKNRLEEKLNFEQYILLFKLSDHTPALDNFGEFKRITPPKDRFWADPFVLYKNGAYHIFVEELIYKQGKGTIVVMEMSENGDLGGAQPVLKRPYHLSYPFLIEDRGQLYMLPETKGNGTIELYKCVDFPLKWELQEVLMQNVQAVDATIIKYNDKFWMFANMKEHPGISAYDELFLFYSEKLVGGDWNPHPLNPIVSDVCTARPAGKIFIEKDKIFRPAQDCAKRYGHSMHILEITKLNEVEYHEEMVRTILPNWEKDLLCTHTLNFDKGLTVVDALIKRKK